MTPVPPLAVRIPTQCRFCDAAHSIVPEMTIAVGAVTLSWRCKVCGRDWPVTSAEEQAAEGRHNLPDVGIAPRKDRRKKPDTE